MEILKLEDFLKGVIEFAKILLHITTTGKKKNIKRKLNIFRKLCL